MANGKMFRKAVWIEAITEEIIVLQAELWTSEKTNKIQNKKALNILYSNVSLPWCNFHDTTFIYDLSFQYIFTLLDNKKIFFAYISLY